MILVTVNVVQALGKYTIVEMYLGAPAASEPTRPSCTPCTILHIDIFWLVLERMGAELLRPCLSQPLAVLQHIEVGSERLWEWSGLDSSGS